MKLVYLYTESDLTPWKENVNAETLAFLISQTPLDIEASILHFDGFHDDMIDSLRKYDLVFNLCYGYKDAGQVEVAGWLEHNGIPHTAASYDSLKIAQDKSLLPDFCGHLDLQTPDIWFSPEVLGDETMYISKPRKGSCHRGIKIAKGKEFKVNQIDQEDDHIIQPFIQGREFSVAVIPTEEGKTSYALPPIEVVSSSKKEYFVAGQEYGATHKVFDPILDEITKDELMLAAEKLHKSMGLKGLSRTDFRLTNDGAIYVLDVNAMPNMDPNKSMMPAICTFHNVSISDLIVRVIKNHYHFTQAKTKAIRKERLRSFVD